MINVMKLRGSIK